MSRLLVSTHEEGITEPCVLQFVNQLHQASTASTSSAVAGAPGERHVLCLWVDFKGQEVEFHRLGCGHAAPQRTYTTHLWRLREAADGKLIGEYCGSNARLVVRPDCTLAVEPLTHPAALPTGPPPRPEWGQYRKRGQTPRGVSVACYDIVEQAAVQVALHIVCQMLRDSPESIIERLGAAGTEVAIIGRTQVTTDIPAHTFLKMAVGGRDLDSTTRGLGGSELVPITSCSEENLLMDGDEKYPMESILVHEFGHTVMNVGMCNEERARIVACYEAARARGLYRPEIYMMDNADEYWAEGTQSWFDATVRVDVNDGFNTRDKLKAHDPGLAALLAAAFGDGAWRYSHDAPRPLTLKPTRKASAAAVAEAVAPTAGGSSSSSRVGVSGSSSSSSGSGGGTSGSSIATAAATRPPELEEGMERARLVAGPRASSSLGAGGDGGGGRGWAGALGACVAAVSPERGLWGGCCGTLGDDEVLLLSEGVGAAGGGSSGGASVSSGLGSGLGLGQGQGLGGPCAPCLGGRGGRSISGSGGGSGGGWLGGLGVGTLAGFSLQGLLAGTSARQQAALVKQL